MESKTIVFEEMYNVSIDDFEDTIAVDKFIESKIGRPLKVTDSRTPLTMRGGNVFPVVNRSREDLEASTDRSFEAVKAQSERLKKAEKKRV